MKNGRTWALIASLTLNVLVAGAVIGALLVRDQGPPGRRDFGGPPEIRAIAGGIDADHRRALFRGLRNDPVLRQGRARMRDSRDAIAAALRSDPFDPAAFEAALAARQAVQAELAARGSSALSDVIATLSPDARAALADRLLQRR
ncbi:MAG: periplasmic heavy metal sensor [Pseudomonadota bacterium]